MMQNRKVLQRETMELPVGEVQVGMFVCELDRPWLETPFILQGFEVQNQEDIKALQEHCNFVYVEKTSALAAYQLRQREEDALKKQKRLSARATSDKEFVHAKNLQTEGKQLTRSFMDDVRLGRAIDVKTVEATVSGCVKSIVHNPDAMMWLSKLRSVDEYTSEHSFNVGLLAITFGRHLGLSEDDLQKLGVVGMLHDIGKMRTPIEILNKKGALTPEEFKIMREHTTNGRDILVAHKNVSAGAVDVAFSHHETLDGKGYPRKINGKGISEFTKIITVCDVYDALTSERCYKEGKSSVEAFRILYNGRGKQFDETLVTEFIECIGLYPPGCIVELLNGHVGIVISINERQRRMPKVLVVTDEEKNLKGERVIDLSCVANNAKGRGYLIKAVLPNGTLGIRVENYVKRGLRIE